MKKISFSSAERKAAVAALQEYCREELEFDLGNIPGELLLDFIGEEIGAYYYNRGLYDAQTALNARLEDIGEAIYALEQPVKAGR